MRDGKVITMAACKLICSNFSYNLCTSFFCVFAFAEFLTLFYSLDLRKIQQGFDAVSFVLLLIQLIQSLWSNCSLLRRLIERSGTSHPTVQGYKAFQGRDV